MRSLPPGWRTTVVHVVIPVALTFLLFISATMLFAVPMLRETMMTSKRETARELTGTVCALLQDYEHRIQAGELTKEEAQQRAIARVHELRYGPEDKDYFWINDQTPTMIMHPYRSDLDGKDISGFADPHGKHLFKEMVARVKESSTGEGYVDYMWQWKDDPNRIVPKVSHVRLFKPWGWIVGTGIYIEDVNNTISAVIRRLLYANLAILAVVGVLSAYLILQGFRRERERLAAQEALKDSEQRLSDIIDFLPDATLVLNSDGTVIAWNRAIEIMTDVPAAEMLGRSDYHYAVPFYGQPRPLLCDIFLKGLESWDKGYNFLSREENQVSAETFVPTLGGQGRYLLVSASPLYDGSGTLVGAIESIRDITVRKKAESNSARLTEILETTSDIVSTALPNGKITYMNRAGRRVLGLPEQGEVGMVENIHPAWAAGLIESEGIPYTLAHGLWRGETAILGADGTEIPTSQVIMAHRDSDGELIYLSTILRDISHIKEAEAEKTRLRNLLGNIIDSMPSVIVGVDPSACVTQWNQQAQEATGISGEEAQGRRIDSVFPDLAQQMQRVQEALRTKQTQYEGKVRREGEGEVQFSDITVYPLVANGTEGAVIRIDDVTQRVRIEEIMIQSEKMMSVGGLAAGMAHEINNPLAGIMQSVQVVQNRLDLAMKRNREAADECGVAMEKIREYMDKRGILQMLDSVLKSGQRAAGIVDNMLSFSRKSESKFAPHDMAALLDRTVWLAESDYNLKRHYDFRKIDIVRMYDPNTPQVPCEATKLQQVFLNILKNGAEAMAEKAGTLREQTDSEGSPAGGSYQPQFTLAVAPDGPMVRIEITDNGPGMPESARKRIFEPFFTTKSVGAGTGLGLSVSFFIIVENHGGQMTVESAPGESTKFIIKLPSVQEA